MARSHRPYTAFVLSGGASLGAVQAGMLRALYERGITPDVLVGTSVGAINAAFIASRPRSLTTANELARVWCGLQREDVFPTSLRALVDGLAGRRDHLVPVYGLQRIVERYLEFEDLADATIPLHLVAFDLVAQREVLLSKGPAIESVLAAASIPGIFPAVALGDMRLIDGGVVNNTPISHAVELGAERIYVLSTHHRSRPGTDPPRGAIGAAVHGLGLLVNSRLDADIARHVPDVDLIVLPAPNSPELQPIDFDHAARLVRDGHLAARGLLAESDVLAPAA